jgi:hypothetical protein
LVLHCIEEPGVAVKLLGIILAGSTASKQESFLGPEVVGQSAWRPRGGGVRRCDVGPGVVSPIIKPRVVEGNVRSLRDAETFASELESAKEDNALG